MHPERVFKTKIGLLLNLKVQLDTLPVFHQNVLFLEQGKEPLLSATSYISLLCHSFFLS